jgi:hypothetical protein
MNEKCIEIVITLEQIQKVNDMLAYYHSFAEPSANSIENYERLREDFLRQLTAINILNHFL